MGRSLMAHTCPNCGHCFSTSAKLSEWERAELRRRANRIVTETPWGNQHTGAGRVWQLRCLAEEYGINIRTLYRYLRRAA